jgi:putative endonuclease
MAYYCYILECADGTYYTGWSLDPERRLEQHNAGQGARYTRSRRPLTLVFKEEHHSQAAAMKREAEIKRLSRTEKQFLIQDSSE